MKEGHSSAEIRNSPENVLVIDLYDSILAVLIVLIQVEADGVKIAGIGTAYLHVPRGQQQLRQLPLAADASSV